MNTKERRDVIHALAVTFCDLLWDELGDEAMQEVIERNAEEDSPNVCHSHDYCDANVVMARAFEDVLGRGPFLVLDDDGEVDPGQAARAEQDFDRDAGLWNAAWDLAARSDFTVQ